MAVLEVSLNCVRGFSALIVSPVPTDSKSRIFLFYTLHTELSFSLRFECVKKNVSKLAKVKWG